MGWFSKTPEEEQYAQGLQQGRAMSKNPQLMKMFVDNLQAQQMAGYGDTLYGRAPKAAVPQQTEQFQAELFPGEEQISGLENITQEAQTATPGTKMFDTSIPIEQRRMQYQKDLLNTGLSGFNQQWAGLDSAMQNSQMSGANARNKPAGQRSTFEMGAPNGMVQRAYLGDDGQAVPVGDPYRAFAPNAKNAFQMKMEGLSSDDPNVVANTREAMRSQWNDVGTGYRNRNSGEYIPKDIAGAEIDKKMGQSVGSRVASYDSDQRTGRDAIRSAQDLNKKLDVLFSKTTDWGTTGFTGKALSKIWGTDAADWETTKDTIVSNVALDKLLEMKASSPTGASGFGALSQRELSLLESNIASLEQSQSPEQARKNIRYIQSYMTRLQKTLAEDAKRREQWYKKNTQGRNTDPVYTRGETEPRAKTSTDTAPNGVKWAD